MNWQEKYIKSGINETVYLQDRLRTPIGEFVVSEIDKGIWSLHKDGEYLGSFQSKPDAKANAENMVLKIRDELLQFCAPNTPL